MVAFLIVVLVLVITAAMFYIRYLRLSFGLKDSNSGGVQHISQLPPKVSSDNLALPGSRMGDDERIMKVREEMSHGLHIQRYRKSKKKRDLGITRDDLRRSYIIDALLEEPKF